MDLDEGYCYRCRKPANLMCRRCFEVYCSTKCQAQDWNTHKSVCIEMPSLAPLDPLIVSGRSSVQSRLNVSNLPQLGDVEVRKLKEKENDVIQSVAQSKRTNSVADNSFRTRTIVQDKKSGRRSENTKSKPTSADESSFPRIIHAALTDDNFKMKISDDYDREVESGKKTIANDLLSNVQKNGGDIPLSALELTDVKNVWQSHNVPPMRDYFEAILQYVEDSDASIIWVMERRYETELPKLLTEISRNVPRDKHLTASNIFVGKLVGVCMVSASNNIIYRAEIIEIFSDIKMALVRFIDYGNIEKVDFSEMYEASFTMLNCKAYTIRVRTTQMWTLEQIGYVINIRIVSAKTPGGYYMAEIQSNAAKLNTRPNVSEKAQNLALEPSRVTLERSSTACGFDTQAENTPLPPSPPATPALPKDTVCLLTKRALEQQQLQQQQQQPPPPQQQQQQQQSRPIHLEMANLNVGKIRGMDDHVKNALPKMYMLEDIELVPIPTGDNIHIIVMDTSQLISEGYFTAADIGHENVGNVQTNLSKVEKYCKVASKDFPSGYSPKIGELCLAVFESDQLWYRAVCCQSFDGDFYQILFIDYGNKSMVKRNNIMPISKELMFAKVSNRCYIDESLREQPIQPCMKYKASIQKRNNCLYALRLSLE